MPTPPLTQDQLQQLQQFAVQEGRLWKGRLRDAWMRGQQPKLNGESSATLYALRNTHGPSWLAGYRLPAAEWSAPQWYEVTVRVAVKAKGRPPTSEDAELLVQHLMDGWEAVEHLSLDDSLNCQAVQVKGPA